MKQQTNVPLLVVDGMVPYGYHISSYPTADAAEFVSKPAHRGAHYIFIVQERGESCVQVDFQTVKMAGVAVLGIVPGQVRKGVVACGAVAWLLVVEARLIKGAFRQVFDAQVQASGVVVPGEFELYALGKLLGLLSDMQAGKGRFDVAVLHGLMDAAMGILAGAYVRMEVAEGQEFVRAQGIAHAFRCAVGDFFKEIKSPSEYAALLHVSAAYLNTVVKGVTGFTVSYWIREAIVAEAKRLLFYTTDSVKEIAGVLGYEDPHYFSRFFTKAVGLSPLSFRRGATNCPADR